MSLEAIDHWIVAAIWCETPSVFILQLSTPTRWTGVETDPHVFVNNAANTRA